MKFPMNSRNVWTNQAVQIFVHNSKGGTGNHTVIYFEVTSRKLLFLLLPVLLALLVKGQTSIHL